MRFIEGQVKDWLKLLPSFEDKVQMVKDLMDYQVAVLQSMTAEQKEKFCDVMDRGDVYEKKPEIIVTT